MKKSVFAFSLLAGCACLGAERLNVCNYGANGGDEDYDDKAIVAAMRDAADRGDGSEVYLPAGTYYIDRTLPLRSNMRLTLHEDAVIVARDSASDGMLLGGHDDCDGGAACDHGGYSQIENVVISGGTLDRQSPKDVNSYAIRIVHGANITIRDMTLRGCSGHFMNLSGTSNVLVENVTFEDPVKYVGDSETFWHYYEYGDPERYHTLEAVHLDYCAKVGEANSFPNDNTPCRHVTVRNCRFMGTFSGVGTHTGPKADHAEDILVTGCRFEGLQGYAFSACGFDGSWFLDNLVTDSRGAVKGEYGTSIEVSGNSVSGSTANSVYLVGFKDGVVQGNEIVGSEMAGVRVVGGSTAEVSDNNIADSAAHAISSEESSVVVTGNTAERPGENGIYINGGEARVSDNVVRSPVKTGIRLDNAAQGELAGNTLESCGLHGVSVAGVSSAVVRENAISSSAKYGIYVSEGSALEAVGNVVSKSGSIGIYVTEGAPDGVVSGNTITDSKERGIRIFKTDGYLVEGNKVSGTSNKREGIYLDEVRSGRIVGNTVSKTDGYGIRVQGTAKDPATVVISGNKSASKTSSSYADIRLGDYCKDCQVFGNTTGEKGISISSTGVTGTDLTGPAPKFTSTHRDTGKSVTLAWGKVVGASGYQIQVAAAKSFADATTVDVSKASTVKASVTGVSQKSTLYARIRTCVKVGKKTFYSDWSKTVKITFPAWAIGDFQGVVMVGGTAGYAALTVGKTGKCVGTLTVAGATSSFSSADFAKYDAKKGVYSFKTSVKVGKKKYKPTFTLVESDLGALTLGTAAGKTTDFSAKLSQKSGLVGKKGILKGLIKKKFTFKKSSSGSGLSGSDSLTVKFADGDVAAMSGTVLKKKASGTACVCPVSVVPSGSGYVCKVEIAVILPKSKYSRLLTMKFSVNKKGTVGSPKAKFSKIK